MVAQAGVVAQAEVVAQTGVVAQARAVKSEVLLALHMVGKGLRHTLDRPARTTWNFFIGFVSMDAFLRLALHMRHLTHGRSRSQIMEWRLVVEEILDDRLPE